MRTAIRNTLAMLYDEYIKNTMEDVRHIFHTMSKFPRVDTLEKDEIRAIHRFIWDYAMKYEKKPATPYVVNCILCQSAIRKHPDDPCEVCLGDWEIIDKARGNCVHILHIWENEADPTEKRYLAELIRDIPFKEE